MNRRERPGLGRDGNVVILAILGFALVILIGFGLPRLLQRREPGLENAPQTADTSSRGKKDRGSVLGLSEKGSKDGDEETDQDRADATGGSEEWAAGNEEHDASLTRAAPPFGKDADGFCTAVEEPGFRASDIKLTQKVWIPIVEDFRSAKREIVSWMKRRSELFPEERLKVLSERIMDLSIQRPPSAEEPDLSWRGGVVMSRFPDGKPLLRVGGGFLTLHQKDPKRARFELARGIAFLLSPCEMKTIGFQDVWSSALSCAQGVAEEGCELGSVSQQAWLVASAIAQETQPVGCKVRAVETSRFLSCVPGVKKTASTTDLDRSIASVAAAQGESKEGEEGQHE
jgi:hypothetical protein